MPRTHRNPANCVSRSGRWAYRDWIRDRIGGWLRDRTVAEIVELGQLFRLPIAPLGNGATIPGMQYVRERGVFVDNPAGFRQPRTPWLMSAGSRVSRPQCPASRRAPTAKHRWQPRESAAPRQRSNGLPLQGVRIVDLTAFWAGPSATHSLAAFGAEVIKVESIQRPDGIRYSGGMRSDVDDWWEYGWLFQGVNTNKRSVTLDLQSADGDRLFRTLVEQADAVIENFSPRVMDQFGLGSDTLLDVQSPPRGRPDAGVRAGGPVARQGRLCAHDGTDRGPGLGDRDARTGRRSRRAGPAIRWPGCTPPSR